MLFFFYLIYFNNLEIKFKWDREKEKMQERPLQPNYVYICKKCMRSKYPYIMVDGKCLHNSNNIKEIDVSLDVKGEEEIFPRNFSYPQTPQTTYHGFKPKQRTRSSLELALSMMAQDMISDEEEEIDEDIFPHSDTNSENLEGIIIFIFNI